MRVSVPRTRPNDQGEVGEAGGRGAGVAAACGTPLLWLSGHPWESPWNPLQPISEPRRGLISMRHGAVS